MIEKLDPRHWRMIRRAFDRLRSRFFTVSGTGRQLAADITIEALREELGRRHFTNSWELSYRYEGEDLNMRRPVYVDDKYEWYQLHIRAFETSDRVELAVHFELEPTEHPYGHLNNVNMSVQQGVMRTRDVLDDAGIEYEDIR